MAETRCGVLECSTMFAVLLTARDGLCICSERQTDIRSVSFLLPCRPFSKKIQDGGEELMATSSVLTRRAFLQFAGVTTAGAVLASCAPAATSLLLTEGPVTTADQAHDSRKTTNASLPERRCVPTSPTTGVHKSLRDRNPGQSFWVALTRAFRPKWFSIAD
jgi:hypothetical protein